MTGRESLDAFRSTISPALVRDSAGGGEDQIKTDNELLAEAKNLDGSQRFYALDDHPATHRLRRHREALKALPESRERDESLNHIDRELARFAAGDRQAKLDYLRVARHRERTS